MPNFAYKGRDNGGKMVQGVLEGGDASAVAGALFNQGITPLEIKQSAGGSGGMGSLSFDLSKFFEEKVAHIDITLFTRQLYTLMKAGVPIMRALMGLQESSLKQSMKDLIQDIRNSLDSGRELSVSFARHTKVFSPFYISMVRVGEMSGLLEAIFLRLFHHMEFEQFMRQQVKSALRYPSFVVMAMGAAIVVVNIFVIPAFAKVFQGFGAELPLMTRVLLAFSNFMVAWWWALLLGAVGAVVAFKSWTGTVAGELRWDELKLQIPVAGKIVQKATLSRFAGSLALALRSGVPVVQAMSVVAQTVDNAFMARKVEAMRDNIERGESVLRVAITARIFTPVVLQMIAVGEESGALDDMMQEVSDMYQREVEYELKTLSAQIEPILIVFLGILVLILALGIFLPIWDLGKVATGKH
ncbi:MAG: type II secretion system F family protein [Rhodocyclaceae bacterium]|nr:MAG: type II secretion system F family protein [Rhodocyclaceae bacterium]